MIEWTGMKRPWQSDCLGGAILGERERVEVCIGKIGRDKVCKAKAWTCCSKPPTLSKMDGWLYGWLRDGCVQMHGHG